VSKVSGRDIREINSRLAQIYYHTKGEKKSATLSGKGAFRKMFGKGKRIDSTRTKRNWGGVIFSFHLTVGFAFIFLQKVVFFLSKWKGERKKIK